MVGGAEAVRAEWECVRWEGDALLRVGGVIVLQKSGLANMDYFNALRSVSVLLRCKLTVCKGAMLSAEIDRRLRCRATTCCGPIRWVVL
jgi:hypothetical protein